MSDDAFVALLRVDMHFPDVGSLKGKRSELNRVKARLRERMGASVAEVAHQDSWQRSVLSVAVTERSFKRCGEAADGIQRFLDSHFPQGVRVDRVIASFNDLESIG